MPQSLQKSSQIVQSRLILQLKTDQIDMDFWVDEYGWSLYGKTDVIAFRPLPANYNPETK